MKKLLLTCLTAFTLISFAPTHTYASTLSTTDSWLDTSTVSEGFIAVHYNAPSHTRTKLMISKNDVNYTYDLNATQADSSFPLQLGNGTYNVTILENTSGNSYKKVQGDSLEMNLNDANAVYLASTQNVDWKNASAVISKAQQLTKNATTDEQKAQAIYNYITTNVKYDYKFASALPAVYVPNAANTLVSNTGICYDYASLNAAMLRSVGVPTKLVMGTSTNVKEYHAWNEVFLNGQWVTVDTTIDATLKQNGKTTTLAKNAAEYKAAKTY